MSAVHPLVDESMPALIGDDDPLGTEDPSNQALPRERAPARLRDLPEEAGRLP